MRERPFSPERRIPLIEQINKQCFAMIETSVTRIAVEKAVGCLRTFIDLVPKEVRGALRVSGENGRGKGSLGFVERRPDADELERALGNEPEHKEYFHYRPELEFLLHEQIEKAGPHAEALVRDMRELWVSLERETFAAVQRLGSENRDNPRYDNIESAFFPDGLTCGADGYRHPKLTLRLMRYMKVGDGALAANNHYDGGMLTFAICESLPGLHVGTPESVTPVTRPEGTALMWTGVNFRKKIDPEVAPTWHGVRQHTTSDVPLGAENRWVLVAFLDTYDDTPPRIEETHGL